MSERFSRDFFKILFVIVAPILFLVMLFGFYLYDRLIDDKKEFLLEKTISTADMISNIAKFDKEHTQDKHFNGDSEKATLSQVQKSFQDLSKNNLNLEYLVGKQNGEFIEFIAYSNEKPPNIDVKKIKTATPIRKALKLKSGVSIEFDYKNQKTLASYAPINGTNWGLVIEQPYSEHIKPLYQTTLMSSVALISFIIFLYFTLKRYEEKNRKKIQESEQKFQQIVQSSDDVVWEIDADGTYTYVSSQSKKIFGYEPNEVVGKKPFDFMSEDEALRVSEMFFEISKKRKKIDNLENDFIHKDGTTVHVLVRGSAFFDEKNRLLGYRGIDRDITLMKKKLQEIEYLAFYDTLTGLANRQNIYEKISQEINYAQRNETHSALLFIDLDDFKIINDTQGHDHGDAVLKSIANRLLESIRSFDAAGRIGGDEFVVLVRGEDKSHDNFTHFDALIERILQKINEPIVVKEYKHQVRASIGVAIIPRDGETLEDILKCADRAMYEAKNLGKNRVVFHKN